MGKIREAIGALRGSLWKLFLPFGIIAVLAAALIGGRLRRRRRRK